MPTWQVHASRMSVITPSNDVSNPIPHPLSSLLYMQGFESHCHAGNRHCGVRSARRWRQSGEWYGSMRLL
jgi:hypothetical protein